MGEGYRLPIFPLEGKGKLRDLLDNRRLIFSHSGIRGMPAPGAAFRVSSDSR